ncbi:MAG: helicase-exonuclease AddAB subunit AddA, partial [Lachnospiraceae bacterium]|nr:helicase-exonuclease AddAB subunit AddA [Lachnospiraceae bacterium]
MPEFTTEQDKVINVRDRDVLVSAAAGSGKTTVLVERIIKRITDPKDPVDIDHMLVVTFTRAAAKDMREKIRKAIEEKSMEHPEDLHLQKQCAYIFHSQITTIDSFCNYLVKNYFYTIGVDPDFRMLEQGEKKLMEEEIMDELMEEKYASGEKAFLDLVRTYSKGIKDNAITEMIFSLAGEALTNPWPHAWLDEMNAVYDYEDLEALKNSFWIRELVTSKKSEFAPFYREFKTLESEYPTSDGKPTYENAFRQDQANFKAFFEASDYEEMVDAIKVITFPNIGNGRGKADDPEFRAKYSALRSQYKPFFDECAFLFSDPICRVDESMQTIKPHVNTLVRLTKDYITRRQEVLSENNAWDFNDIEHFALEILVDKDSLTPTEVAQELRGYFAEIMVDEYQDSNALQETILRTLSREDTKENNYFMVGDIKQSIYRFRQARPEIFAEKYESFTDEDSLQQRIELNMNFRSRREVLNATNSVFSELMDSAVGGVAYPPKVALNYGADYPEGNKDDYRTEVLIGIKDKDLLEDADMEDKSELEAVIIAKRIAELVKECPVCDKKTRELRPMRYSDIAILMRAGTNGENMMRILNARGIPAVVEKKTGYFDAMEVKLVLSLLQVLNNPRADIPLASVMHSVLFSFTNEELAQIRVETPKGPYHKAVFAYRDAHPEDEKIKAFFSFLERYRQMTMDTPIHLILQRLYEETGYLSYVSSLPAGEVRRANLQKLVDLSVSYEKSSFKGLFRFCHYIEELQKYDTKMGEADVISEEDDAVSIMTIHKSKGLEYPIVFLAEVGKKLEMRDAKGDFLIHASGGIALNEVDPDKRTKRDPLFKKYISERIKTDSIGEEMRVLYVAMTRAKEKLIITGTYEENAIPQRADAPYTNLERKNTKGYGNWMLPIFMRKEETYDIRIFRPEELVMSDLEEQAASALIKKEIRERLHGSAAEDVSELEKVLEYTYPYETAHKFKAKYSVSELKHKKMEELFEEEGEMLFAPEKEQAIKKPNTGALRGSAMHRFMELFDFTRMEEPDAVDL